MQGFKLLADDGHGMAVFQHSFKDQNRDDHIHHVEEAGIGQNLENIRFICMDAREIEAVFAPAEVDKIFLNFSDPWPKARHAKRRLTSTEFLARYEKVLVENGRVEFKTDNTELFNFSLEQVKEAGWELLAYTYDLHHQEEMNKGNIMTEYEQKFSEKGNPINKLIAQRK